MLSKRRTFLQAGMAAGTLAVAAGAGLLTPRDVLGAWPEQAFKAKKYPDALQALAGTTEPTSSDAVKVKAPDIAENGAVVPVTVTTSIQEVESISIIAANNPVPLVASYNLGEGAEGFVSTRIKMGKSGDVIAVVKSGSKLYSANKGVKVTIGGCGG